MKITRLRFEELESRRLLSAGNGLQAYYFGNSDFTSPVMSRIDPIVDFNWGLGSPDPAISPGNFSARWAGRIEAGYTEPHSFIVNAQGGVRLWVNNQLIIDRLNATNLVDEVGQIDLVAGRRYDLVLEYSERSGTAGLRLEWSSTNVPRQTIPTVNLLAAQRGGLLLERWNAVPGASVSDLLNSPNYPSQPNVEELTGSLNLPGNSGDQYGRRLRGFLHAPITGLYSFFLSADEQAELWLSPSADSQQATKIAAVTTANPPLQWFSSPQQRSAPIFLASGQKYYIEVLHKESAGDDHLAVGWVLPGQATVKVIGAEHLSPMLPEVRLFARETMLVEDSSVPGRFTFSRHGSNLTKSLTVQYAVTGSATSGVDYQAITGQIVIPAGSASTDLLISPVNDTLIEGDETVRVEIIQSSGYEVSYKSERVAQAIIQDNRSALPGGTSLWSGQNLSNFTRFGGTFTSPTVPGIGQVIQAAITSQHTSPWNAQLTQPINSSVTAGDILWVEFSARTLSGPGHISAIFERNSNPYTKSLSEYLSVGPNWTKFQFPFIVLESYAAGQATFGFHLGYAVQTLQFTGFSVLKYGPPKTLADESSFFLNNLFGTHGNLSVVPIQGQPFNTAHQVQTFSVPSQNWHLQIISRNGSGIQAGETIRVQFYARAVAGTNPRLGLAIQRTDNFNTLHFQQINLTNQWQLITVDLPISQNFAGNGLQVAMNLGYGLQTVQVGGYRWTSLNRTVDLSDLPTRKASVQYGGRSASDPWRSEADNRIDTQRKVPATIVVRDQNGQPLDGAVVSIRQRRHDFKFGSAIDGFNSLLSPTGGPTALKYQQEIKRLFNTVTIENSLKWPTYLQVPAQADQAVNFTVQNNLYLRGHNLIWPSRQFMPTSIWAEYDSRVQSQGQAAANQWLRSAISSHFNHMLTTFAGRIPEWDVVNEPFSERDVMNLLGNSIVVEWFQQVRNFDPSIRLTLNDYDIFSRNGGNTAHRADFEQWLSLLRNNQLLDVIGEQSHYVDGNLTDIPILGNLIQYYHNQFVTPIAITEFDITSGDPQLQADYLRDYLTMSFSQPGISQFVHWGFWEGAHWRSSAALYNVDFSIRPHGQAYEDLVFGRWWTDASSTTRSGQVNMKAVKGQYNVVVQYGGQTFTFPASFNSSNGLLEVNLPVVPMVSNPVVEATQSSIAGPAGLPVGNQGAWFHPLGLPVVLSASLGTVSQGQGGTWQWSYLPSEIHAGTPVTITATDAQGRIGQTTFQLTTSPGVVNSNVYYRHSSLATGGISVALDSSRQLARETPTPTMLGFVNLTNAAGGINGLVFDVAGLSSNLLLASDFRFQVSPTGAFDEALNPPSNWTNGPLPDLISVIDGPLGASTRIIIGWPNNSILNRWLRITLLPSPNTGIVVPQVFYIGHLLGETTGAESGFFLVSFADITPIRQSVGTSVNASSIVDIDKNGLVAFGDITAMRSNVGQVLTVITVSSSGPSNAPIGSLSSKSGQQPKPSIKRSAWHENLLMMYYQEATRVIPAIVEDGKVPATRIQDRSLEKPGLVTFVERNKLPNSGASNALGSDTTGTKSRIDWILAEDDNLNQILDQANGRMLNLIDLVLEARQGGLVSRQ